MGIEEVHQKTPDLSIKEKFLAQKEKLLHGKDVDDAKLHEIKLRADKLEDIREKLHTVSKAMKGWEKSGGKMAKATGKLATALPNNKGDYSGLSTDMKHDLESESSREAIKEKLHVIDDMLKDASVLDDLLYLKHRRERKTESASDHSSRARRSALATCAHNEYETLYDELMGALRSVVESAENDGLGSLVAPELNAFKKLQEDYFSDAAEHVKNADNQPTGTAEKVFENQHTDGFRQEGAKDAFQVDDLKNKLAEAEGKAAAAGAQHHQQEHYQGASGTPSMLPTQQQHEGYQPTTSTAAAPALPQEYKTSQTTTGAPSLQQQYKPSANQ